MTDGSDPPCNVDDYFRRNHPDFASSFEGEALEQHELDLVDFCDAQMQALTDEGHVIMFSEDGVHVKTETSEWRTKDELHEDIPSEQPDVNSPMWWTQTEDLEMRFLHVNSVRQPENGEEALTQAVLTYSAHNADDAISLAMGMSDPLHCTQQLIYEEFDDGGCTATTTTTTTTTVGTHAWPPISLKKEKQKERI